MLIRSTQAVSLNWLEAIANSIKFDFNIIDIDSRTPHNENHPGYQWTSDFAMNSMNLMSLVKLIKSMNLLEFTKSKRWQRKHTKRSGNVQRFRVNECNEWKCLKIWMKENKLNIKQAISWKLCEIVWINNTERFPLYMLMFKISSNKFQPIKL